jgi:hypothetical protein
MHVLFVHQSYPSEFGPVAEWMSRSKDHRVTFVSTDPSRRRGGIDNLHYEYSPDPGRTRRCRGVTCTAAISSTATESHTR